jgi:hypothetical protein
VGDTTNLWQLPISPEAFQFSGPPGRLTAEAGVEGNPTGLAAVREGRTESDFRGPHKIVITMDERLGNVWISDFGAR